MHTINIGYGRRLFQKDNSERERLAFCASATEGLHLIVFTLKKEGLMEESVTPTFSLYPTHSRSRSLMMFDAYRIARRIARARKQKEEWCVTAQDPLAAGVVGYFVRMRTGLPLIVEEHGDIFSGSFWRTETWSHQLWYFVARFIIRRADRVRAVSKRVATHLLSMGVHQEKIVILPVFSDILSVREKTVGQDLRKLFPESSPRILSVARFVSQKNLLLLLCTFAALYRELPGARLVVVGSGPLKGVLKRDVVSLHLESAVSFLPWSDDVFSLMKTADIYALSSNYEGWARVLIEAMACGLPAVTTEIGCVGEIWENGVHGISVPVGDEKAFAGALLRLASDSEKRKEYGAAGMRDASQIFKDKLSYARAWAAIFSVS